MILEIYIPADPQNQYPEESLHREHLPDAMTIQQIMSLIDSHRDSPLIQRIHSTKRYRIRLGQYDTVALNLEYVNVTPLERLDYPEELMGN
jgi:hypothetical protein